jgi:tripartite-type tricarboxylate transporter receptor subunit TctC
MREALAYLRANSGRLNYASAGAGTLGHLITEAFLTELRVSMTHVPYKGAAPVYPELMADRISLFFDNPGSSVQLVKAGKVRALAVSRPVAVLPGVPTLIEAGLKGFTADAWFMAAVPAGTPQPIIDRLYREIAKILPQEDVKTKLDAVGVLPSGLSPKESVVFLNSEINKWREVIKAAKITLD